MSEHMNGLIAAPFAPLREDRALHTDVIPAYAAFLLDSGVIGAFVNGSSGEGPSLTTDERMAVAERWVAAAPAGFTVIVHVGHTCLAECRRMTAHAAAIGAQGVGMAAPYYFRPATVEDLVDWSARVASAAPDLPFYFYHIPALTGVALPMREYLERAAGRIPNFAGIKYTHDDLADYERCIAFDGDRFDILFGRDELLVEALDRGCRGAIGSTYNFTAPLYRRLIDSFRAGDRDTARKHGRRAADMIAAIIGTGCGIGALKAAMKIAGIDCGPARPPLRNPGPAAREQIRAALHAGDTIPDARDAAPDVP